MTKKLHLLLYIAFFLPARLFAQSCPPNIDFEMGNFSNWQCSIGTTNASGTGNNIVLNPSPPTPNRHELITTMNNGMDQFGNFPKLCPYGGGNSVKLGNTGSGSQAEGISYTFQIPVTQDTFSFTYFYAVVFENPPHSAYEQPRFFVTAYDVVTGQTINCASYNYIATSGIPGFQQSAVNPDVLFKPWSPVSIQFAGLAGRTVRLEFKTADCTLGAHFGYAYLDVSTGCSNILATAPYCAETNSVILNAPFGFQTYTWYNANYTAVIGNQQSITLSPPPATNGVFHVDVVPYAGFGCRDTLDALITPLPVPVTPTATDYFYCRFQTPVQLTPSLSPNCYLLWYTTPTGGIGNTVAPVISTNTAGVFTYYVSQKVLFGCESLRKQITVTVVAVPTASFTINNDRQCLSNNQFIFTSNSIASANATYDWDFGDSQTITAGAASVTHTYANAGTYNVKLTVSSAANCNATKTIPVTVVPKPVADFTFPAPICEGQTAINITNTSTVPNGLSTINNWWWSYNGNISTLPTIPSFTANIPGQYIVKLVVKTPEGCKSDTSSQSLNVRYKPTASFTNNTSLCENEIIKFTNTSSLPTQAAPEFVKNWYWEFDNTINTTAQNPTQFFTAGSHQIKLVAESDFGCKSAPLVRNIVINAKPKIQLSINDSCVRRPITFTATDVLTGPNNTWFWDFGNGPRQLTSPLNKNYNKEEIFTLVLVGQNSFGCKDTLIKPFKIFENKAFAGRDTVTAINEPVQLNAHGDSGSVYMWSPAIGLNSTTIGNPIAILDRDQLYYLNSISKEGCDANSKILIRRYLGPELYIPSAFTPNKDYLNDVLHVFPVGIRSFDFFAVYNRFGERLFYTTDYNKGWDGTYKGQQQDPATYVVVAKAIDYKGNVMLKKLSVILIR